MDNPVPPKPRARILVVDDSAAARLLIESALRKAGYEELTFAESAGEALIRLGLDGERPPQPVEFDVILMDFLMPEIDGIQACRRIKESPDFLDVPLIMVTAENSSETLKEAFDAGAIDYVTKPVNRVELLARVKSALRLKQETDCRKQRELQLVELTEKLKALSVTDGLTGIANRRNFDEKLGRVWRRAQRESLPVSLILTDIDHFKSYNDCYGHLAGDECLRQVAQALQELVERPYDLVARYGGEEFSVVLPDTTRQGANFIAEAMREAVESLAISHRGAAPGGRITISSGVATLIPELGSEPAILIAAADVCLYQAKCAGRNRVVSAAGEPCVA